MTPRNRRLKKSSPPLDALECAGVIDLDPGTQSPSESEPAPPSPSQLVSVLRAIAGTALVLCVSTAVAWAARHHILTSPRFSVIEIDVTGQHQRTADQIAAEALIARGANIFQLDLDRARAALLADPWISDATLARRLPGTILVQITERELGAIVALPETYLASRDGVIFKRLEPTDPSDLPVITGLTGDAVAEDREGSARSIRRALDLASDYEHMPLAQRSPLEEIHLAADGATTLVVGTEGLAILMGQPPFRKKLEEAARIVAELDRRGAKADAVMLDDDARPERAVVRMR